MMRLGRTPSINQSIIRASNVLVPEQIRGQRGLLLVQAFGYVNSSKVILGLPETAGMHFLLRPMITQFRNAGFVHRGVVYWYVGENWYFWMDKSKWEICFHNFLGITHAKGRKCSSERSTKTKRSGWTCYKLIKVVAAVMDHACTMAFFKWNLLADGVRH